MTATVSSTSHQCMCFVHCKLCVEVPKFPLPSFLCAIYDISPYIPLPSLYPAPPLPPVRGLREAGERVRQGSPGLPDIRLRRQVSNNVCLFVGLRRPSLLWLCRTCPPAAWLGDGVQPHCTDCTIASDVCLFKTPHCCGLAITALLLRHWVMALNHTAWAAVQSLHNPQ